MDELWKPIVGLEDRYEVSNLARVRNIKRGKGSIYGQILRQQTDKRTGYWRISLKTDDGYIGRDVHRLVAEAFLGPCPPGYEVNHKDRKRHNARADNLEYVTRAANIQHAQPRRQSPKGTTRSNIHLCKLTDAQVRRLRRITAKNPAVSRTRLAHEFGVSKACISNVLNGITYNRVV